MTDETDQVSILDFCKAAKFKADNEVTGVHIRPLIPHTMTGAQPEKCWDCRSSQNTNTRISRIALGLGTTLFLASNRHLMVQKLHDELIDFVAAAAKEWVAKKLEEQRGEVKPFPKEKN